MQGTILVSLTAILPSLRPQPCQNGPMCRSPSKLQFGVLYASIALASIGQGGVRFTVATFGASQFHKPKDQGVYFNWFFFTYYIVAIISATAIVYVEDNVSWAWGFGLSVVANLLGLTVFLLGSQFYRHVKPERSPFVGIAQVVVAAIRKREVNLSSKSEDYYHGHDGVTTVATSSPPTKSFRFLNHAAIKTEGDAKSDGSIAKPWKLCTVQEVEDLKALLRIFPLSSTSIFLVAPICVQANLVVLQALTMDRRLGSSHFRIPAASMLVFVLVSTAISLIILDWFLWSAWQKLVGRPLTPLQRIGVGHVLNVTSMAVSALIESKRRSKSISSVLWLVPQLAIVGIGEAFHFPGQVAFNYQEFPALLKNMSAALTAMVIGITFYLSSALSALVRRVTGWLPDDIDDGRLDNVYWILAVLGTVNFSYYLCCAWFYKYQNLGGGR
ncbi:hypothetical protein RJ640_012389 [Escallonia rubra]|uniref:Uncharacterized protein n=1 Tax=Escallonia rubra TaxID=112253 RepID=A0AA88QSC8_9ASTE|nr:hypothetical protein RJ640_012389 [Escallonia rubra]